MSQQIHLSILLLLLAIQVCDSYDLVSSRPAEMFSTLILNTWNTYALKQLYKSTVSLPHVRLPKERSWRVSQLLLGIN